MFYRNPLRAAGDLAGFRLEGDGAMSFPRGRLRLESLRPPEDGQDANVVLWCPEEFGPAVTVEWDFWPVREPGLAILFFHARGRRGEDIFDLAPRTGPYEQYHHGDLDAYHVSYFVACGRPSAACTLATCARATASTWSRRVPIRCLRCWTRRARTRCA
jgi:hypothetical protein